MVVFLCDLLQDYRHRTIELSDDETNGEEDQTEDEEEEEDEEEAEEEEEETDKEKERLDEKEKDGKEPLEKVEQQEIKTTQPIPQPREEASVPDGPIKDAGDKDNSSPLIEEKPLSQNETKLEKSKSLFGSSSKLSLFKRRSSTKDKQGKEKAEAPLESTTSTKPSAELPLVSSESGDPEKSSSVEDPIPRPLRSRSATCSLL